MIEGNDRDQDRVREMLQPELPNNWRILGLGTFLQPCHMVAEWEHWGLSLIYPLYLHLLQQQ
jgi:hypothetical protein